MRKDTTHNLTVAAMLSAVAFILMFIEFPVPMLIPSFVKMDFSDLPALLGAFALGPVYGVVFNFFLINPTRQLVLFGQSVTVWGAGLAVPGAALGTALSTVVGGLLALGVLLLRDGPLCIRKPGSWRITSACLRNLWRVGAPLAAERAALSSAKSQRPTPDRAMMAMPIAVQSHANRLAMSRRWAPTACPMRAMEAS